MEGGTIKDFMDCVSYEDVYFMFRGKKYFTTGVESYPNNVYRIYCCELGPEYQALNDLLDLSNNSLEECLSAFENMSLWGNGKTIYDVEKEIEWIDG